MKHLNCISKTLGSWSPPADSVNDLIHTEPEEHSKPHTTGPDSSLLRDAGDGTRSTLRSLLRLPERGLGCHHRRSGLPQAPRQLAPHPFSVLLDSSCSPCCQGSGPELRVLAANANPPAWLILKRKATRLVESGISEESKQGVLPSPKEPGGASCC